ncbi:hypothetical protein ACO2RV_24320 [Ancylobacter sp. VNQ12]|uniref:hypothetical protein n=1 Tax=Ancylobacter sp. VNQ12 TaxID=3400920 RepID=UPI003BFFBB24
MIRRLPSDLPSLLDGLSLLDPPLDVQGGVTSETLRRHLAKEAILHAMREGGAATKEKQRRVDDPKPKK